MRETLGRYASSLAHALVATAVGPGDDVHRVSVVARGTSLGTTAVGGDNRVLHTETSDAEVRRLIDAAEGGPSPPPEQGHQGPVTDHWRAEPQTKSETKLCLSFMLAT